MTNSVENVERIINRRQVNNAVSHALRATGALFPVTDGMRERLIDDIIEDASPVESSNPLLQDLDLTLTKDGGLSEDAETYLAGYSQQLGELRVKADVLRKLGLASLSSE